MSPIDAWLTLMSVETLPLRMSKHSRNAEIIAAYLVQHPKSPRGQLSWPTGASPVRAGQAPDARWLRWHDVI